MGISHLLHLLTVFQGLEFSQARACCRPPPVLTGGLPYTYSKPSGHLAKGGCGLERSLIAEASSLTFQSYYGLLFEHRHHERPALKDRLQHYLIS